MRKLNVGIAVLAGASSIAMARPALAQDDAPQAAAEDASSDIVVIASRRSERLQDVPLASSAIGGEQLMARST